MVGVRPQPEDAAVLDRGDHPAQRLADAAEGDTGLGGHGRDVRRAVNPCDRSGSEADAHGVPRRAEHHSERAELVVSPIGPAQGDDQDLPLARQAAGHAGRPAAVQPVALAGLAGRGRELEVDRHAFGVAEVGDVVLARSAVEAVAGCERARQAIAGEDVVAAPAAQLVAPRTAPQIVSVARAQQHVGAVVAGQHRGARRRAGVEEVGAASDGQRVVEVANDDPEAVGAQDEAIALARARLEADKRKTGVSPCVNVSTETEPARAGRARTPRGRAAARCGP